MAHYIMLSGHIHESVCIMYLLTYICRNASIYLGTDMHKYVSMYMYIHVCLTLCTYIYLHNIIMLVQCTNISITKCHYQRALNDKSCSSISKYVIRTAADMPTL